MTALRAADIVSTKVVEVQGEWRPMGILDEMRSCNSTHAAVFENGKFLSLVRLQDVLLSSPQRIFADLVPERTPSTVSAEASTDEIRRLFSDLSIDAVVVLSRDGRFAGIVRHQDFLQISLQQTNDLLGEKQLLLEKSKRSEDKLLKAQEELESRVSERTAKLSQVNERLIQEIADRKRAEEALRESNRHLEQTLAELKQTQQQVIQQERLRALGQMAGGVAHDLNNSLSPVLGYAELIASAPELPEKLRGWAGCIETGARDAAAVVERLREFYRPQNSEETGYETVNRSVTLTDVLAG